MTDQELIKKFQETGDTTYWKLMMDKFEKAIFNAMNKFGKVTGIPFKDHELYGELGIAMRYAMLKYDDTRLVKGKKIKFNTFLNSTFKIYIRRYYTNRNFKTIYNYDDNEFSNLESNENIEHEVEAHYITLLKREQIDEALSGSGLEGLLIKLQSGTDCRKPYKFYDVQKIVSDYVSIKRAKKNCRILNQEPPAEAEGEAISTDDLESSDN